MRISPRFGSVAGVLLALWALGAVQAGEAPARLRVATYNASLNREAPGELLGHLANGDNAQAKKVAEVLQIVRPDVVLINEFDFDEKGESARRFHDHYLAVSQRGHAPLNYPYRYAPPVNTGVATNTAGRALHDFDHDGKASYEVPPAGSPAAAGRVYAGDAYGFGAFPGQYGFVVYSRFPIRTEQTRTFQLFKWRDMPGAVYPKDWYTPADMEIFRLSSKNHADVPIELAPGTTFHLLASHPTPPSFDGAEDRNGRRNHDEIRLWADYLNGADYLRDDAGRGGGLPAGARFVILGDLNADPVDGDSYAGAILQLLNHPRVNATFEPASLGGVEQARLQGGFNAQHKGNPALDTGDFGDARGPGNLRIDHVLPSKDGWRIAGGAVFWPEAQDPNFALVDASDHRLVYLDLEAVPVAAGK